MDSLVADLWSIVTAICEKPTAIGAGCMTALVGEGEINGLLRGLVLVDVAPSIEVAGVEKITAFMRSGMDGFESLHGVADAIAAHNLHHTQWPRTRLGVMEGAAIAARAIRVPTLLIRGAEGACELLSVIPGSRMVDVADAGHMVAGDDNDVVSAAVEGFLRDPEPRT
jgi:pimeloyl-ACP methyl ester carboxylesterase